MEIRLLDDVKRLGIFVAYSVVKNVVVRKSSSDVKALLERVVKEVKQKYNIETLKDHPIIRAYRDFFWRIDVDPTKVRPSSEALVRRVLRNKPIPLINNVVDLGNIASLETLISIGIYDLDNVRGNLMFRLTRNGEVFMPIGGKTETLRKSIPVLSDFEKILHLYPHRDSVFTMITESTRNVLVLAAGVPGISLDLVQKAAEKTSNYLEKYANGSLELLKILA